MWDCSHCHSLGSKSYLFHHICQMSADFLSYQSPGIWDLHKQFLQTLMNILRKLQKLSLGKGERERAKGWMSPSEILIFSVYARANLTTQNFFLKAHCANLSNTCPSHKLSVVSERTDKSQKRKYLSSSYVFLFLISTQSNFWNCVWILLILCKLQNSL